MISGLAVIAAWLLLILRPATPDFDTFTPVAAVILLVGYLFQIVWAVYLLPSAALYTRLTITRHTPPRHSWTLWVLPATVPILVLAVITPWSLPTDSYVPGMPLAGVLGMHLMLFTIAALAAVVIWMLLFVPLGLLVASVLPRNSPGASLLGRLPAGTQRWAAAITLSVVGFCGALVRVSSGGIGRSRFTKLRYDLWELVTLTGEPRAVMAAWVFLGLCVFFLAGLARSTRRAAG